ncbi:MAG: restriction endonuclease subunit S [Nitrosopumilus sp.]|uniref:restriction endonuclease subunit S n=1 Tax=Nitrosopumilus sp. TaxID=2024843 RepID=UPI00247E69C2|nr:restriction endonuclease subunit S [Nitrosopumilus sp.]MCV0392108.1 restriction endonuclease subunit S [Nitrosopumilus sp.]
MKKPKPGYKFVEGLFGKKEEIPEDWDWQRIGENSILKGRIGWQGLTTAEYRDEGEFYLVTGTDFKNGRIDWENCVYIDKERYDQDTNIQLKKGDVLVTKDGTIGKIAFIDKIPIPSTLNTGVFVIRPLNKKYHSLFLFYILYSNYFTIFLNRLKGGSTINHLYQKDFVNFHFPIPPIKEQEKITNILSNIDSLIDIQKKIIGVNLKFPNLQNEKSLEMIKVGLMQKLLTGQIRVKV